MTPLRKTKGKSWNRYEELVLFRLDEQNAKSDAFEKKVDERFSRLENKVDGLKLKVATVSAAISTILTAGLMKFFGAIR